MQLAAQRDADAVPPIAQEARVARIDSRTRTRCGEVFPLLHEQVVPRAGQRLAPVRRGVAAVAARRARARTAGAAERYRVTVPPGEDVARGRGRHAPPGERLTAVVGVVRRLRLAAVERGLERGLPARQASLEAETPRVARLEAPAGAFAHLPFSEVLDVAAAGLLVAVDVDVFDILDPVPAPVEKERMGAAAAGERQDPFAEEAAPLVFGIDHRRVRRVAVIAAAPAEARLAEPRKSIRDAPRQLQGRAVVFFEKGLVFVFLRVAHLAEDLLLPEEGPVVEQRHEAFVLRAVGAEQQRLVPTAVAVVYPQRDPLSEAERSAEDEDQVHQRVGVPQVLVFGVVGRRVVERDPEGETPRETGSDAAEDPVLFELLVARILVGVLHQIEGRLRRVDEIGAGEPFGRKAAVADLSPHRDALRKPAQRSRPGSELPHLLRRVIGFEAALLERAAERDFGEGPRIEGEQPRRILALEPAVVEAQLPPLPPLRSGGRLRPAGGAGSSARQGRREQEERYEVSRSHHLGVIFSGSPGPAGGSRWRSCSCP